MIVKVYFSIYIYLLYSLTHFAVTRCKFQNFMKATTKLLYIYFMLYILSYKLYRIAFLENVEVSDGNARDTL